MSTLGWISLVLAALAAAIAFRAARRRSRSAEAHSPRTVADLVRLRAAQADAARPDGTPRPWPGHVAAGLGPVIETAHDVDGTEVPAAPAINGTAINGAAVVAAPSRVSERTVAVAAVPASADDTPWNRAARIAESDGVVWATDHDWAGWADWADWADVDGDESGVPDAGDPARPVPVRRPVVLPAFPPELVDTRTAVTPAAGSPAAGLAAGVVEPAEVAPPAAVEPAAVGSPSSGPVARPSGAAEAATSGPGPVEPAAVEPAAAPMLQNRTAEPAAAEVDTAETPSAETPVERPVAETRAAEPVAGEVSAEPAADPAAIASEPARARRSPAETAAEQAAADLALLRTFGCSPAAEPDGEPYAVALEGVCAPAAPVTLDGAAQPVAFRVVGRDGAGVAGAGVTLLDDRGREAAGAVADAGGAGTVLAPRPGSYVLVSAAADHQPGAVAITVVGEPVAADLLLARSASLSGTVHGEDGPVVGARLTLVQAGEVVDGAESGPDGEYRIGDLAAGEYGLSVTAVECEPAAVMIIVPEETDLRHDVELDPVGLGRPADDMMIGLS